MRIAIGLFGFLATIHETDVIKTSLKALPKCSEGIDIYYYGPNIIHESNLNKLDTANIENKFKNVNIGNICFKWFDYDPSIFINICKKYNFPILAQTGIYPYRILSMFYNIKGTIDLIKSSEINYDYIILVRNDYITHIKKYEDLFNINIPKGLFVMRYDGNAEDRVIYGTSEYIFKLCQIYECTPDILKQDLGLAYGEGVLKQFIFSNFNDSTIFLQKGIQPLGVPQLNKEFKRTSQMRTIVEEFYKNSK